MPSTTRTWKLPIACIESAVASNSEAELGRLSVLSVRNLVASFRQAGGWNTVVDGMSFDIGVGNTVALVGESGSGKSVTALSIMGLLPRKSTRITGQAFLDGTDLLRLSDKEMEQFRGNRIAMIFQEPMTSLNPVYSVGRQIAESLERHQGMARRKALREAVRLMDRVRIPAAAMRAREYPHEMSGGMLQRVMIATALACRPRLLIADEPTTALDVTIQAQILQLIKELQDEQEMGVLFITHDMGVVAETADRTVVMFRSKMLEQGSTSEVFSTPRTNYTRTLLAAAPRLGEMAHTSSPQPYSLPGSSSKSGSMHRRDSVNRRAPPLLSVQNLTTRFDIRKGLIGRVVGRIHAVEGVSFDVAQGETLALVGESGCGKSTTGRSILRLVEPCGGKVVMAGRNLGTLSTSAMNRQRQSMQMIFQDPFSSLNPRMRVGAAIMEPMIHHRIATRREAEERVSALLEQVGLSPDMAKLWPHEFSGGQRQRIAIARTLALNPALIVADESVSALDATIKAQVVNLMMELQERLGLSYLFISHDMAVVERVSHRVAVMLLGEIVEIGPRDAVFSSPQHPYTRRLLSSVPVPDPARRLHRQNIPPTELKSPIRPPGYVPPKRDYRQAGPGHLVMAGS